MQSLRQALDNIAGCAAAQKKEAKPLFRINNGTVYTYNGTLGAQVKFSEPFPEEDVTVDAASLLRVWQDGSTAEIVGNELVIKSRRTTYHIPIQSPGLFEFPSLVPGGELISAEARDAILLAAKFVSQNAAYPWATGVTLYKKRAIATNNLSVVSVKCDTTLQGLIPSWAIAALRDDGEPPHIRIDSTGVSFTYADSTIIQSAPLASEAPEKILDLTQGFPEGDVDIDPIIDAQKDMFRVKGKHVTLDPSAKLITVTTEDGTNSETVIDFDGVSAAAVKLQQPILKLILDHATHIGFQSAPEKLIFSSDKAPEFIGIAAGMV